MRFVRIGLLVAGLGSASAALLLVTRPARPSATLVGLSVADQQKIAEAKAKNALETSLRGFAAKLRAAAGDNAIDCGLVPLAQPARTSVACGENALQKNIPFSLAVEFPGTDTSTWVGIGQDRRNNHFRLVAMCDPWSCASALANPRMDRCSSISLQPRDGDRAFFACHPIDDPTPKPRS